MADMGRVCFVEDEMTIVVQVRGKVRAKLQVPSAASKEEVLALPSPMKMFKNGLMEKRFEKRSMCPRNL